MKIFGFLQVRNEVDTGHLARFLKFNGELFDKLYAIDDGSTDGTADVLEASGAVVLRNVESNFKNESQNKAKLLKQLAGEAVEGDAILWLDADEVLLCSRYELSELITQAFESGFDSISLNHLNLWRSNYHYRLDDQYFGLQPVRIWRYSMRIMFPTLRGLHGQTHPIGLVSTLHSIDYPVIHFGFAALEAILAKYAQYDLHWQSGYPLDRLVNEDGLHLLRLDEYEGSLGARFSPEESPEEVQALSPYEWKTLASRQRGLSRSSVEPIVTIVCLIFKSISWLEFAYGEALRLQREFKRGEVNILFVANDASKEVLDFLAENRIPHVTGRGKLSPQEWYINSVYRSYNEGVSASNTPWVYLINSDMAFAPGALSRAFATRSKTSLVATRLVERGILISGTHGIERDFGSSPSSFRKKDFIEFATKNQSPSTEPGGLFMPLLVNRASFLSEGGFPEGNLKPESTEGYVLGGNPQFAEQGEVSTPGDRAFFERLEKRGFSHITVFDSLAYHFQEGELRSGRDGRIPSGFAIMNDLTDGINGEEVLWTRLKSRFSLTRERGVIETGMPKTRVEFFLNPIALWIEGNRQSLKKRYRLILANGTFQLPNKLAKLNAILIQDRVKGIRLKWMQSLAIQAADKIVSNDLDFVASYRRKNPIWLDIKSVISEPNYDLQANFPKTDEIRLVGIFIGAFNSTKGFSLLRRLIESNSDVNWILVSKIRGEAPAGLERFPNVQVFTAISHERLSGLMIGADFLVGTSPWETQHLASLEAVSSGVPVYITPSGFLGYKNQGRHDFGRVVAEDRFLEEFQTFKDEINSFDPAGYIVKTMGFGEMDLYSEIEELLQRTFLVPNEPSKASVFLGRLRSYGLNRFRFILRRFVVPMAIKLKRFATSPR